MQNEGNFQFSAIFKILESLNLLEEAEDFKTANSASGIAVEAGEGGKWLEVGMSREALTSSFD